ncbi:hypothetical protein LUX09_33755 [Streptomyces albogriseolus]|nr:hypothetical protein [Streptomyces albogriseolus]
MASAYAWPFPFPFAGTKPAGPSAAVRPSATATPLSIWARLRSTSLAWTWLCPIARLCWVTAVMPATTFSLGPPRPVSSSSTPLSRSATRSWPSRYSRCIDRCSPATMPVVTYPVVNGMGCPPGGTCGAAGYCAAAACPAAAGTGAGAGAAGSGAAGAPEGAASGAGASAPAADATV